MHEYEAFSSGWYWAFVYMPRKKPSWIYGIEVYIELHGGPKSTQIVAIFARSVFYVNFSTTFIQK